MKPDFLLHHLRQIGGAATVSSIIMRGETLGHKLQLSVGYSTAQADMLQPMMPKKHIPPFNKSRFMEDYMAFHRAISLERWPDMR